jgi:hypothetical protein
MPFHVHEEGGAAVIRFDGSYEITDARTAIDAALALFPGLPAFGLILDVSDSYAFTVRSSHQIRMMALYLALHGQRFSSRVVAVAPTELAYGLMRMGSVTAAEHGIVGMVVRDYASACAWLEMDSGQIGSPR